MQSGDILLVRINDSLLITNTEKESELSIYAAARAHNSCDTSDTSQLDITPLIVDGKKLIALYDKDVADGVNQIIGN